MPEKKRLVCAHAGCNSTADESLGIPTKEHGVIFFCPDCITAAFKKCIGIKAPRRRRTHADAKQLRRDNGKKAAVGGPPGRAKPEERLERH